ncbi:MAG: hypothetical protein AAGB12_07935 [Pseudomonadota bacterium]
MKTRRMKDRVAMLMMCVGFSLLLLVDASAVADVFQHAFFYL